MKAKPQVHFWREVVCAYDPELKGQAVIALHACRAWDVPANGVFMLFMGGEMVGWENQQRCRDLVREKLEARERALVAWYGREAKHHLDQFDLTPVERRESQHRRRGAGDPGGGGRVDGQGQRA